VNKNCCCVIVVSSSKSEKANAAPAPWIEFVPSMFTGAHRPSPIANVTGRVRLLTSVPFIVVPFANNGGPPTNKAAGAGNPVSSERQTMSPICAVPESITISCPFRIAFKVPIPPLKATLGLVPSRSAAVSATASIAVK